MKSFVLRWVSLLVIVAVFLTYQVVSVGREKDDQIARLQAEVQSLGGTLPSGSSETGGKASYKDGTYVGEADGFGGPIEGSVTVKDGELSAVKVLSHDGEDEAYYTQAEGLLPKILETGSTDLDVVSGATYSSNGILHAVQNALEQAV